MAAAAAAANFAKRLQGKVALITGGASGIGEETARLFARNGAKVIIADVQSESKGKHLSEEIRSESGQQTTYIQCDVTKESDVEKAVNAAVSMHGKLDIMYNNAGITGKYDTNILEIDVEDFRRVLDINLTGAFLGAKHAARVMIPKKRGSILFTSSIASVTNGGMPQGYTASKHGVVGLMHNLTVELGKHGIRVNCVSPAGVPTATAAKAAGVDVSEIQKGFYSMANLKEVNLDARDIAEAAMFLGSDESKYVSGVNLVVDGGFNLRSAMAD
ncbi:short chain aldehyde dehydrogenase 1-like [Euphorbia lathyris]|uniref:short chain aldehyde dehydrogenase 1-like n=1 Tax=Euphorbia lathyris TaxID=212925 RepID=UPI003313D17B